ncbi:NAD(P)-dependent oxidoreductase [Nocardiopsis gilva YIM 90087]|uniref:NAD(P)-dependent oxidoreductase n=2 Tax=Nocardiopsis gilva TaxID=280236 RepID=A0A223SD88_9ACTN|nr:SDR family oxidoreductase [Nocardiopsis gilva]ASU86046.1 NAD(P)-dependent oxidoreductase [Nocardiopsis gilva YIM 90087]
MGKSLTVITGASSGIGAATARAFSGSGHPLLLLARRMERMQQLELPNAMCRAVDVTDRSAVTAAVKEAEDTYGPADVLVNNAGVMLNNPAAAQDPDEWDRMIDINIRGLLNGVHAVLPGMTERQHGTIVNVSSIAGRKSFPGSAVYSGTKHAVHAASEAIRAEAAPSNVRVIVISPGFVDTELSSHITDPEVRANYQAAEAALEGGLSATTVADAILYAYRQPHTVCIREIALAATGQTV